MVETSIFKLLVMEVFIGSKEEAFPLTEDNSMINEMKKRHKKCQKRVQTSGVRELKDHWARTGSDLFWLHQGEDLSWFFSDDNFVQVWRKASW